ncbi:unnamed protein product [Malus baccata var. baccata]
MVHKTESCFVYCKCESCIWFCRLSNPSGSLISNGIENQIVFSLLSFTPAILSPSVILTPRSKQSSIESLSSAKLVMVRTCFTTL